MQNSLTALTVLRVTSQHGFLTRAGTTNSNMNITLLTVPNTATTTPAERKYFKHVIYIIIQHTFIH